MNYPWMLVLATNNHEPFRALSALPYQRHEREAGRLSFWQVRFSKRVAASTQGILSDKSFGTLSTEAAVYYRIKYKENANWDIPRVVTAA